MVIEVITVNLVTEFSHAPHRRLGNHIQVHESEEGRKLKLFHLHLHLLLLARHPLDN